MKKLAILCSLVCLATLLPQPRAEAQTAQFQFTPLSSLGNSAPGATIQFSIHLIFTAGGNIMNVQGLTFFLQQTGAGPYIFTITGRDNERMPSDVADDSPFNDEISTNSQIFANNPQLNPTNGRDLGALADNPLPSGTYFVANLTLSIAPNAPLAVYTIQSTTTGPKTSVINDSNGNTIPIQPGSITITPLSIPEPSSIALLLLAGSGLLANRIWSRRRPSDR